MKLSLFLICMTVLPVVAEAQTVTDIDTVKYDIITIGKQVWMKQNLRVIRLNDGTQITYAPDNSLWNSTGLPAFCLYNDSLQYLDRYGFLYNWFAVSTGKLCPAGWHVPNDAEWSELVTFLGGNGVAGGEMKETGTVHWRDPNEGATNSSGFTGLPGGYRTTDDIFISPGTYVAAGTSSGWWSSTAKDARDAFARTLYFTRTSIARSNHLKSDGFSVRCIKDSE